MVVDTLAREMNSGGSLARRSRQITVRSTSQLSESGIDACTKIVLGVCAMDKKAKSKPMKEILSRMTSFNEFTIVDWTDQIILDAPVEEWPRCDCLLSWHSDGFPLKKAQAYVALRRPFCVNDLQQQEMLLDRRRVYRTLMENNIPVPQHIIVSRDELPEGAQDPPGFIEDQDYVELNGVRIFKPFVEKPISGEDHNIYIYYPHSMGGGVKCLFRKVGDKSADYEPNHPGNVRREGSYIYEEFLTTGGTDVKVYTVGPRYAHAEARKSPVVDGKVQRSSDGKELRFPVLLSPQEKEIARMVSLAFGQKVCGFDLLRSERGRSFVCDVNGWSFVKNSRKYYDDAAGILRSVILNALAPHRLSTVPLSVQLQPTPIPMLSEESEAMQTSTLDDGDMMMMRQATSLTELDGLDGDMEGLSNPHEELRCVLAVVRHGDRTPKQKLKLKVDMPKLLSLFEKHKDAKGKQAKLKSPLQLQDVLDATRELMAVVDKQLLQPPDAPMDPALGSVKYEALEDLRRDFRIVCTVLEQGGHFSGVNRKVQFKPLKWSAPAAPPAAEPAAPDAAQATPVAPGGATVSVFAGAGSSSIGGAAGGSTGSMSGAAGAGAARVEQLLLVLKWGGVLTHAGRQQAENLGTFFRSQMYPRYGPAGGGLLRLHSTYRHDLKIYSSDEGRVQTSAAAFTKGLLDLEGNSLTPILVSLVNKDASMLEAYGKGASEEMRLAKETLCAQLTQDPDKCSSQRTSASPTPAPSAPFGLYSAAPSAAPSPPISPDRLVPADAAGAGLTPLASPLPITQQSGSLPASLSATPSRLFSCSEVLAVSGPQGVAVTAAQVTVVETAAAPGGAQQQHPAAAPVLQGLPDQPKALLHRLVQLMSVLVDQLYAMCKAEGRGEKGKAYSSLSQAPEEWECEAGKPCSGERLLLMFDRWRKLLTSFYSEKKGFDISKIPDIYDSVKHDAIHNAHLGLQLKELYAVAKQLADAVIPHEYGLDPAGKLSIGSKICKDLLGKLLADMANMREESIMTAGSWEQGEESSEGVVGSGDAMDYMTDSMVTEFGRTCLEDEQLRNRKGKLATVTSPNHHADRAAGAEHDPDQLALEDSQEVVHRLCPTYASDINSPLRHVRTRIYFTSESHIHSLVNVLRFCYMRQGYEGVPLVNDECQHLLDATPELDYLTHIVFRMYENKSMPIHDPQRFRVEVSFSPGAAYNPCEVTPINNDHTLPVVPRVTLNAATADTLHDVERLLAPFSVSHKVSPSIYALQVALRAPAISSATSQQGLSRNQSACSSVAGAAGGLAGLAGSLANLSTSGKDTSA